jgi:hypothetical protein
MPECGAWDNGAGGMIFVCRLPEGHLGDHACTLGQAEYKAINWAPEHEAMRRGRLPIHAADYSRREQARMRRAIKTGKTEWTRRRERAGTKSL